MLACCFKHEPDFFSERARTKHEDHDQGVREAHFCSVDGAISCGFDDCQEGVVTRVEDDLV